MAKHLHEATLTPLGENQHVPFVASEIPAILVPKSLKKRLEEPVNVLGLNFYSRKKVIIGCLIGILAIIIFQRLALQALFLVVLFFIGAFSVSWKILYPEVPVAFELFLLATAVAAVTTNPLFGILYGILIVIIMNIFGSREKNEGLFFGMIGIAFVAVAAYHVTDIHPGVLGVGLTILFDAFTQTLSILGNAESRLKAGIFISTHLIGNFLIFQYLFPFLVTVVAGQ